MNRASLRGGLLAAALMLAGFAPAHAQIGKMLKQAGKNAVAGAAGAKAENTVGSALGTGSSSAAPGAPKFDENVVELTPARLEQVLEVARADVERHQFNQRRQKLEAEERRQKEAHETCSEQYQASQESRVQGLIQRIQAAQAKGDYKQMQALGDTMTSLQQELMQGYAGKCGAAPDQSNSVYNQGKAFDQKRAAALASAGLTEVQYNVAVERIVPLCKAGQGKEANGNVSLPGDGSGIFYVYTAAESEAITARCGMLMPLLQQVL